MDWTAAPYRTKDNEALRIIDDAVGQYSLDAVYVMLSGGNDSLALAAVAQYHPLFKGVFHANTQTGPISQLVSDFVRQTCKRQGWELIEKSPATSYEMLIVKYGFPGPAQHQMYYSYLKERPLRQCRKTARKRHNVQKIGMLTGKRQQESAKRRETPPHEKASEGVFIHPLYNWSKMDCREAMAEHGITENPAKKYLDISAECMCAAHAGVSERKMAMAISAMQAKYIAKLEAMVEEARALQLLEVEWGYRKAHDVMPAYATKWAHGRGKNAPDTQVAFDFLCAGCVGALDPDGNVGTNPDLEIKLSSLEIANRLKE